MSPSRRPSSRRKETKAAACQRRAGRKEKATPRKKSDSSADVCGRREVRRRAALSTAAVRLSKKPDPKSRPCARFTLKSPASSLQRPDAARQEKKNDT